MQVLDPLAVRNIRLSSGNVLDVVGVYDPNVNFSLLQNLEQGNPIHARRLHRDRPNPALLQPVGQPLQIGREGLKALNGFRVSVARYGNEYLRCTNVDSGSIGLDNG